MRAGAPASPALPLWLEQGLFAGQGGASVGLQNGFKPHQLPSFSVPNTAQSCTAETRGQRQAARDKDHSKAELELRGEVPAEVLERSEFLLPVSAEAREMHERVLDAIVD